MTINNYATHVEILDDNGMMHCLAKKSGWIFEEPNGHVTINTRDGFNMSFLYSDVSNMTAIDAQDMINQLCTYFHT